MSVALQSLLLIAVLKALLGACNDFDQSKCSLGSSTAAILLQKGRADVYNAHNGAASSAMKVPNDKRRTVTMAWAAPEDKSRAGKFALTESRFSTFWQTLKQMALVLQENWKRTEEVHRTFMFTLAIIFLAISAIIISSACYAKRSKDINISPILLCVGMGFFTGCMSFLQNQYIPLVYDYNEDQPNVHDFSYVVGPNCDTMEMGTLNTAGKIRCVKVVTDQRALAMFRSFMEIYIASLLLSATLLKRTIDGLVKASDRQLMCKVVFVWAILSESIVLFHSAYKARGYKLNGVPETADIFEYNMLYEPLMKFVTDSSVLLRLANWIAVSIIIWLDIIRPSSADVTFADRDSPDPRALGAECGTERPPTTDDSDSTKSATRFVIEGFVQSAYMFCYLILMSMAMFTVLYFYERKELTKSDFSYIVAGDCSDELKPKGQQYKRCVEEYIIKLEYERQSLFLLCFVTVTLFYLTQVADSVGFFSKKKLIEYAQLLVSFLLIFESCVFVKIYLILLAGQEATDYNLENNDPNASTEAFIVRCVVTVRTMVMIPIFGLHLYDLYTKGGSHGVPNVHGQ